MIFLFPYQSFHEAIPGITAIKVMPFLIEIPCILAKINISTRGTSKRLATRTLQTFNSQQTVQQASPQAPPHGYLLPR